MCALVAAMVTVGGATRLTDSGLSIVEWRPVTGAIPPLSDDAWRVEFEKYKSIPEYEIVNQGMSVAEFKRIYWWEWGHRLLGRLLGVAFLLPFLYFLFTRRIDRRLGLKLGGIFVLGGLQGALGWWMVSSGLSDRVDVSQYRLAAHLALAVALFAAMFLLALDLRRPAGAKAAHPLFFGAAALGVGVYAQMILGAIVAGLRAGKVFNTWPLMDGRFVPEGYFSGTPSLDDLFETAAAAQFNHRTFAYLIAAGALGLYVSARGTAGARPALFILLAVLFQIALGVATVVTATPLSLGLLHQAGALGVLSTALYAAHAYSGALISGAGSEKASSPAQRAF